MTVCEAASSGATRCHVACVQGCPCRRATGGPLPPWRTRSVTSPTSMCSSAKPSKKLTQRPCPAHGDRYPRIVFTPPSVVLAPLAGGPSTPQLAAAVTNAGGLGFVAAGYLAADELAARIAEARRLTDGPLGVNVFVLERRAVDHHAVTAYARELEPDARRLGVELGEPRFDTDELAAKIEAAPIAVEALAA